MKLSCSRIKAMILDEKKGYHEYKKYNLNTLAKDEYRHKIYLNSIKKKMC